MNTEHRTTISIHIDDPILLERLNDFLRDLAPVHDEPSRAALSIAQNSAEAWQAHAATLAALLQEFREFVPRDQTGAYLVLDKRAADALNKWDADMIPF